MRLNPGIKVRKVAGENIVMRVGADGSDMTTVIAFNESSLLLVERLQGRTFSIDDAVAILLEEYDVDEATARADVEKWVEEMRHHDMLTNG